MVFGDAGDDQMTALPGADTVAGGDGNDVMVWNNGDGTDKMDGEGNTDEVVVNGAAAGEQMAVTANGQRVKFDRTSPGPFSLDIGSTELLTINGGDGDDTISGASGLAPLILLSLNGGAAADTITGGDGSDLIAGGDGNDTLSGAGEQDRILGELGDDTTTGGDGDDTLVWNNGDNSDKIDGAGGFDQVEVNGSTSAGDAFAVAGNGDRAKLDRTNLVPFTLDIGSAEALQVNGLGGDDTLTSAPAPIGLNVDGGTGNDNLEVRDGTPGFVRCGSGTDSAVADESFVDLVLADCESVDRTLPTPPPPTPVADTTGLPVVIGDGTIRVTGKLGKAQAPIAVTCPAAETGGCRGRLTLTTAGPVRLGKARVVVVLGSANYALAAGKATKVKVKLPSTLKRIVGKKRTLKARAAAVGRDAAGNRSEAIGKRLTLRLPKR
jgi:hypothetical protein